MRLSTLVVLCMATACAPIDEAPEAPVAPQEVTFTATDFAYTGPDTIAPGMTRMTMVNDGPQPHHLILIRIDDGHTYQELIDWAAANPNAEPEWITFYGAANVVPAGGSTGSTMFLPEGQYALVCFVPDPADGGTHLSKGMTRALVVTGPTVEAPEPVASARIEMADFGYEIPTLVTGTHTFEMSNSGSQVHEAQLVRLADGATAEQFLAALAPGASGPPPGVYLGGSGAISPGVENWWTVDLAPGEYLMICFIPDAASHAPHFVMGMVESFSVTAS